MDITKKSKTMFATNAVELMIRGTSGWSKARVHAATATEIVEESAAGAVRRIYVNDVPRTSLGTNDRANAGAAAMKTTVMIKPIRAWKQIMVYDRLIRDEIVRVVLSPIMSQAVLGSPSLSTSTMVKM